MIVIFYKALIQIKEKINTLVEWQKKTWISGFSKEDQVTDKNMKKKKSDLRINEMQIKWDTIFYL